MRLTVLGSCGAWPDAGQACSGYLVELARDADLLLAEATYVDRVPDDAQRYLSSARQAGWNAANAGAGHLLLTHLQPGTDQAAAQVAARDEYDGAVGVATADLVVNLP